MAQRAEAYAEWLDKRDRHLAIFEANREKIFRSRNLAKEQTAQCLKCASGISTNQGFLCVIHPMGLNFLPCRDWSSREKQENFPVFDLPQRSSLGTCFNHPQHGQNHHPEIRHSESTPEWPGESIPAIARTELNLD